MDEPTPAECNTNATVCVGDRDGTACWYPQMGGYTAPAVIVPDGHGCTDVHVWHDGRFPFRGGEGPPVVLHHCDPDQFIEFGQLMKLANGDGRHRWAIWTTG